MLDVAGRRLGVVRLRLTDGGRPGVRTGPSARFDAVIAARRAEADAFYDERASRPSRADEREVMRQALAGLLWSKQYYGYDVERWLRAHGRPSAAGAAAPQRATGGTCAHADVISMPDKWEYPWFAAWDLAFHCVPLAMVDPEFAKQQLAPAAGARYQHPNGQIPAYEWNFARRESAGARLGHLLRATSWRRAGPGDSDVPARDRSTSSLMNFTWWVNRKDPDGNNVFQGGFLGLDNIGVFDRSAPLPTGGHLEQADGTAWMALYCQTCCEIALELAEHDPVYVEQAPKFSSTSCGSRSPDRDGAGGASMWDEDDGFFYDLLRLPDGSATRLAVRSMVGLLPLAATTFIGADVADRFPELIAAGREFVARHTAGRRCRRPRPAAGRRGGYLLSMFDETRLRRILARMLDEEEFLGPYGVRSLSKVHAEHPYEFRVDGSASRVAYTPAESDTGMFGGNSNWRGPVWFPVNALLIRALVSLYAFYGEDFRVECPTGSGKELTLYEVAREISDRLTRTFLRGDGRPPAGLRRHARVPGGSALARPAALPGVLPR